jgi:CBS domain-containing protein
MSSTVISVPPSLRLKERAQLLTEHQISGVPVVDGDAVVGVVSEADVLMKQVGRPISRRRPLEWIFGEARDVEEVRRRHATIVREAMSSPAITISPDQPVAEAARTMVDRKVNRLPVVDGSRLVGIVTRADLVRAYVRPDDELEREIR